LLAWSLEATAAAASIRSVIVAAPAGDGCERASALIAGMPGLHAEVVAGGVTRADSVLAALELTGTDLVLVHDAARPLAPPALFDAIVARLEAEPGADAVIAATPVADTIKREDGDSRRVAETVSREGLWAAQTPQGFRADALRDAQVAAAAAGTLVEATDEARLIEAAGGIVLIEPAPAANLKVTTPDDLLVAEALLRGLSG